MNGIVVDQESANYGPLTLTFNIVNFSDVPNICLYNWHPQLLCIETFFLPMLI